MNKLLVISTDKDLVCGMNSDTSFWNFVICTVSNSDNLFSLIEKFNPDLLIVDFILNDSNGGAICHQIKTNPATRFLPVILLSEYPGIFKFTTKFGCDLLLQKPLDNYTLLDKITNLLNRSHLAAQA